MLDAPMKTQLEGYLQNLRTPIRLIASLDSSDRASEMRELLVEIASLSDKVSLDESGSDGRKPSFVIAKEGETRGVRFAAIPLGHGPFAALAGNGRVSRHRGLREAALVGPLLLAPIFFSRDQLRLAGQRDAEDLKAKQLHADQVVGWDLYVLVQADRDRRQTPQIHLDGRQLLQRDVDVRQVSDVEFVDAKGFDVPYLGNIKRINGDRGDVVDLLNMGGDG